MFDTNHLYDPKCRCGPCNLREREIAAAIQNEKPVWSNRGCWGSGNQMISPNLYPSQKRND